MGWFDASAASDKTGLGAARQGEQHWRHNRLL